MECYCDVLVLRHPVKGSADEAALAASIPVLNAGDGTGEHPTQALLDLYTIRAELGGEAPAGKTVTLVGDLKNGRTVHSLALLISRGDFKGVRLCYVTPPELRMPDYIKDHIKKTTGGALEQKEEGDLATALKSADVVYVTRVQKERFEKEEDYDKVKGAYVLTAALLTAHAKAKMAVLHPLPRVDEIATDCDDDPRAAYFRQMKNGMYVRMALLALALGVPPP
jgi:aspartate carbamoyltransferase